jgi:hypothetical protein
MNTFGAIFNVVPDTSWLATGEPLDLTDYFKTVSFAAAVGGVDAIGDAGYKFDVVIPTSADTDITASNVLVSCTQVPSLDGNAASAQPLAQVSAEDLSGIATLRILVFGRQKI